jgi:aryl-alcohol dehydrogenase-like predicted oxidoreductase
METKRLGKSNISVSAIGLGGMPMSLSSRPPESQSIQVIHRALDLGITFIDTADSYCKDETDKHHNEKLIAKALSEYAGDISNVIVATKGGLMRPNGAWTRNGNPEHLRTTIRESFAALGGEKAIDLWQYHSPDPEYSIKESLTVAKAVAEGLIKFVGVSNFSVEQIKRAREIVEIVSVQNQFNPWYRAPEIDGVLKYCDRESLTFLPWSPLGGSRRVGSLGDVEAIAQLAKEKQVSVYCIVLAWLRSKSPSILPIPGASKVASIEDSVRSLEVRLTEAEIGRIDRGTES